MPILNGFDQPTVDGPLTEFNTGIKNVKIYVSDTPPTTAYEYGLENNVLLFDGQIPMNTSDNDGVNFFDIPITPTSGLSRFLILDIADCWGATNYMAIRRINIKRY